MLSACCRGRVVVVASSWFGTEALRLSSSEDMCSTEWNASSSLSVCHTRINCHGKIGSTKAPNSSPVQSLSARRTNAYRTRIRCRESGIPRIRAFKVQPGYLTLNLINLPAQVLQVLRQGARLVELAPLVRVRHHFADEELLLLEHNQPFA